MHWNVSNTVEVRRDDERRCPMPSTRLALVRARVMTRMETVRMAIMRVDLVVTRPPTLGLKPKTFDRSFRGCAVLPYPRRPVRTYSNP